MCGWAVGVCGSLRWSPGRGWWARDHDGRKVVSAICDVLTSHFASEGNVVMCTYSRGAAPRRFIFRQKECRDVSKL